MKLFTLPSPHWVGRLRQHTVAVVAGVLACNSPALQGAETDNLIIEEIVVTATKRGTTRVQDVPIAISAFDASRLEELGASQFDQWAGQVSGLHFEDWGPGDKDFVIRGINSPTGATVGAYFGEAVVTGRMLENGGGRQVDFKLHDIERVEVLKGPQGTLYGANSMAGTIRIIPEQPDIEAMDAYIKTEWSDTKGAKDTYANNVTSAYATQAMLNLPLAKNTAALRLVGWKHQDQGYIDNIRYQESSVNDADIQGGRVLLRVQTEGNMEITGMIQVQTVKLDNDNRITPAGIVSVGAATPLFGPAMPDLMGGDNISTEYVRTPWDEDARIYSLTAEWNLPHGSVTATTNLFSRDIDYIYDSTPILIFFNAPVVAITRQIQEREVHTTEIRYASALDGPFNFVAGVLYQKEDIDFDLQVLTAGEDGIPIGTFSGLDADDAFIGSGSTIFGRTLAIESENKAVFGEINYRLSAAFNLTLGARYVEFESQSVSANTHPFFGFKGKAIDFQDRSTTDSKATFKANLTYEPHENVLLYANVAQGFRPGGTNAVILPINVTLPEGFGPDELTSYEVGAKISWLNNRVLVNTALYTTDWKDIQTGGAVQSFTFIDNLGDATVRGLEFDVRYRPDVHWDVSAGGSWIHAALESDEPSTVGDFPGQKGDKFPNVPRFSGFVAASYSQEFTAGMEGHVNLDYTYRGSSVTEFNGTNPYYNELSSYGIVNFTLGLNTEHWDISLFVRNLLDEDEAVDIIENEQEQRASIILRPRSIGLRLAYRM